MKRTTFETQPFAEGRFRFAYKGTWIEHPTKQGQQCVIKKNKDSFVGDSTYWKKTIEMYEIARTMATSYNAQHTCTRAIKYTDIGVLQVIKSSNGINSPRLNESVIVEDYLDGDFTKWTNNYGYIAQSSKLMPAFMHWSWVESKGERMIADLQGVRNDNEYLLTDPVIMSNSVAGGQYGCTDTGVEGIAMFFLKHECNQFCDNLRKPSIQDVVTSSDAQLQIFSLGTSTAYSKELKIPYDLKERMTSVFPNIATGLSPRPRW